MTEQWGPGNKADAPAFDHATAEGGEELELFFGEHPHSRQDNTIYARASDGHVVGFSGHRAPVSIAIEEYNYLKSSGLSSDEYRKGCRTKVSVAGRHVYSLGYGRDFMFALTRLPDIVTRLLEHPVRFWDDADLLKLEGRKVFYKDTPARVLRWNPDSGVFIAPDQVAFPRPGYAQDDDAWDDEYGRGLMCDILSGDIYWWRD